MKTFDDLQFNVKRGALSDDDLQAVMFFDNGRGVSVIRGPFSYGGDQGLYELAVLKVTEGGWELDYSTSITNDVEGYLNPHDVTRLMQEVQSLPKTD